MGTPFISLPSFLGLRQNIYMWLGDVEGEKGALREEREKAREESKAKKKEKKKKGYLQSSI